MARVDAARISQNTHRTVLPLMFEKMYFGEKNVKQLILGFELATC